MDIIIHNHYVHDDADLMKKLSIIIENDAKQFSKLDLIIKNQIQIMANEEQFRQALARVEAATTAGGVAATAIQARIDALVAAIQNAGLPADVEASLLAQTEGLAGNAEALAAALTAMGASATTPVPVPVPDPVVPVG